MNYYDLALMEAAKSNKALNHEDKARIHASKSAIRARQAIDFKNSKKRKPAAIAGGIAGVAGGASAAALMAQAKKYERAAEKTDDEREKRIYLAKADRYKKMAIAAGAVGGASLATAGVAAGGHKVLGASAKYHSNQVGKQYEKAAKAMKESFADGYYAALCEMEEVEDIYLEGYYDAITNY